MVMIFNIQVLQAVSSTWLQHYCLSHVLLYHVTLSLFSARSGVTSSPFGSEQNFVFCDQQNTVDGIDTEASGANQNESHVTATWCHWEALDPEAPSGHTLARVQLLGCEEPRSPGGAAFGYTDEDPRLDLPSGRSIQVSEQ